MAEALSWITPNEKRLSVAPPMQTQRLLRKATKLHASGRFGDCSPG